MPFFWDNLIYFFDQMPQVLFVVWLLFEGGIYFIGKLADSNDSWIKAHAGDIARSDRRRVVGVQPLSPGVSLEMEFNSTNCSRDS